MLKNILVYNTEKVTDLIYIFFEAKQSRFTFFNNNANRRRYRNIEVQKLFSYVRTWHSDISFDAVDRSRDKKL
jgi:hypothetical protein